MPWGNVRLNSDMQNKPALYLDCMAYIKLDFDCLLHLLLKTPSDLKSSVEGKAIILAYSHKKLEN